MSDEAFSFDLPSPRKRSTLSLAPLIDATFILLIFFMLVSQFGRLAPVDLAVSRASSEIAAVAPTLGNTGVSLRAVLQLHADGAFMVNGRHYPAETGLRGAIDLIDGYFSEQTAKLADAASQPRRVMLNPDPGVTLQQLIDALAALKARPEFAVSILTPPDRGEREADE
jgi:biopolymer transport protein ExbD